MPFLVILLLAAPSIGSAAPADPVPAVLRAHEYVPGETRPDPELRAALRRTAADVEEDPVVRGRALTLLARAGDTEAEPILRGLMAAGTEPFLRRKALESFVILRGATALQEVRLAYETGDARMREACARALRRLGPAGAELRARLRPVEPDPEVRRLLADPDPQVPERKQE